MGSPKLSIIIHSSKFGPIISDGCKDSPKFHLEGVPRGYDLLLNTDFIDLEYASLYH